MYTNQTNNSRINNYIKGGITKVSLNIVQGRTHWFGTMWREFTFLAWYKSSNNKSHHHFRHLCAMITTFDLLVVVSSVANNTTVCLSIYHISLLVLTSMICRFIFCFVVLWLGHGASNIGEGQIYRCCDVFDSSFPWLCNRREGSWEDSRWSHIFIFTSLNHLLRRFIFIVESSSISHTSIYFFSNAEGEFLAWKHALDPFIFGSFGNLMHSTREFPLQETFYCSSIPFMKLEGPSIFFSCRLMLPSCLMVLSSMLSCHVLIRHAACWCRRAAFGSRCSH